MEKLDWHKLIAARWALQYGHQPLVKNAFVPMPGGQPPPQGGPGGPPPGAGGPPPGPQGGPPPGAGGPPPGAGGPPPGAGGPPPGPQGGPPPEILQDPQIMQLLQQNGIVFDPQQGSFIDQASGQPIPAEQIMQAVQQMMAEAGPPPGAGGPGGPPPGPEGPPPGGGGVPPEIVNGIKEAVKSTLEQSVSTAVMTAINRNKPGAEQQHMIAKYEADLSDVKDALSDLAGQVQQLTDMLTQVMGNG